MNLNPENGGGVLGGPSTTHFEYGNEERAVDVPEAGRDSCIDITESEDGLTPEDVGLDNPGFDEVDVKRETEIDEARIKLGDPSSEEADMKQEDEASEAKEQLTVREPYTSKDSFKENRSSPRVIKSKKDVGDKSIVLTGHKKLEE